MKAFTEKFGNIEIIEVNETGKIIRPNYHQGTGRFGSTNENKMQVESLLRKMGIDFTSGNDAPKCGKTGEWIMLKF